MSETRIMKRVAVLPWPGIEGAFLCVSGKRRPQCRVGDRWYPEHGGHDEHKEKFPDEDVRTIPCVTFTFQVGNVIAEWDGDSGPVQLWFKSIAGYKEEYDEAGPHWFWPYAFGSGHWSQMAVRESGLPRAFTEGDYESIFRCLKGWAESRAERAEVSP